MSDRLIRIFSLVWLGGILHAASRRLIRYFPAPDATLNGDAYWIYLPNARKWLEHSWTFFTTDPYSYHVAPLGYWWAALWAANPAAIQFANCFLFLASILLMWRSATLLGGFLSGAVSTAILVHLPELTGFIPQVLTEPIYLFGWMLCATAIIEYILSKKHALFLLCAASIGLTITLLSRPVLQLFAIAALLLTSAIYLCTRPNASTQKSTKYIHKISLHFSMAIAASLIIPASVVVKNGLYFDVWGLGTGAGTGLLYGVSPFKAGQEPIYYGFKYDAYLVAKGADPTTDSTLSKNGDSNNARTAISTIKNTSLNDNMAFFGEKLHAWLLYSTPELKIYPNLRSFRTFEWLSIFFALTALLCKQQISKIKQINWLPGKKVNDSKKHWIFLCLLLFTMAMAVQLTPVLYNARYNIFFLEPPLMLLCGASIAILSKFACACSARLSTTRSATRRAMHVGLCTTLTVLIVCALAASSGLLTRTAQKYETSSLDPYRLGPTQPLLVVNDVGTFRAAEATRIDDSHWRLNTENATLFVSLRLHSPKELLPTSTMDAIWRFRLAVTPSRKTHACSTASIFVLNSYPAIGWYEPPANVHLTLDGSMHTYAIHGNDQLRPAGDTEFAIRFHCPADTQVRWGALELVKSTLPEAAGELAQHGKPINPYNYSEPGR